jgi:hypothetical protein
VIGFLFLEDKEGEKKVGQEKQSLLAAHQPSAWL